jgi:hypothetical protein
MASIEEIEGGLQNFWVLLNAGMNCRSRLWSQRAFAKRPYPKIIPIISNAPEATQTQQTLSMESDRPERPAKTILTSSSYLSFILERRTYIFRTEC